jgi:hypothetical protein
LFDGRLVIDFGLKCQLLDIEGYVIIHIACLASRLLLLLYSRGRYHYLALLLIRIVNGHVVVQEFCLISRLTVVHGLGLLCISYLVLGLLKQLHKLIHP